MNSASLVVMFVAIIIVGLILLAIIVFAKQPAKRSLDKKKYRERWLTVTGGLDDTPAAQQLTIIHADKLLDAALKERGFAGNTLGERMKSAQNQFSDANAVWSAHKLRNQIAHDDEVKLDIKRTQRALDNFKRALSDLGAL